MSAVAGPALPDDARLDRWNDGPTQRTDAPFVERRGLESAINWARFAGGILTLGLAPVAEGTPVPLALAFGSGLVAYSVVMHRVLRSAGTVGGQSWIARANMTADATIVVAAMAVFAPQPNWTAPTIGGILLVIVGAFRLGTVGAIVATTVASLSFLAIAGFREQMFGFEMPLDRAAGQVGQYLITALLMIGIVRELHTLRSAQRVARSELERRALYDELTGMPNRTHIQLRLEEAILAARGAGGSAALLLLDLDRFKDVNDTFGHRVGDQLLQEVGAVLRQEARASDIVGRLGGDEFGIVLPGANADGADLVAEKVILALQRPFVIDGQHLAIDASIGIVVAPEHGDSVDVLLSRADMAMYAAKDIGAGHALYEPEKEQRTARGLSLMAGVRRAIARDELVLHYQPQLDLARGTVVGVEALIRWQHPERGLLPPSEFMLLVEQSSLARPVTDWVLGAALREAGGPLAGAGLRMAVNLTMRDLWDPGLLTMIRRLMHGSAIDLRSLVLEMTERTIMSEPERVVETLEELRSLGVRLAIDDFGTGYSSLAYLQRLPVTELKLDKSFVHDLMTNEGSAAIARATIDLGHALGMEVVAEGVEDAPTFERLNELGCDIAQGNFIARPMPAAELSGWLGSRS